MLRFKDVSVSYGKNKALDRVSIAVAKNTITAIVGENGSGKTTLFSAVTGRIKHEGEILFEGKSISDLRQREKAQAISLLPQYLPSVEICGRDLIAMGRQPYRRPGERLTDEDYRRIDQVIAQLNIREISEKRIDRMSGGEKQKAFIAMVLAQDTRLILLDEPASHLDADKRKEIYNIIEKLKNEYGKTVAVIMHELTDAVEISDRIVVLKNGRAIFSGDTAECLEKNIIEKTFSVKKISYSEQGKEKIIFR